MVDAANHPPGIPNLATNLRIRRNQPQSISPCLKTLTTAHDSPAICVHLYAPVVNLVP